MGNKHFVDFFGLFDSSGLVLHETTDVPMTKCHFQYIWKASDATFITQSLCTHAISYKFYPWVFYWPLTLVNLSKTVKVLVLYLMICGICYASRVIEMVTWACCLLEMAWSNLRTLSGAIDSICKNACHTTWSNLHWFRCQ